MKARDFVYWLQGWLEIEGVKLKPGSEVQLTGDQVRVVRNHLALVFKHEIDPEDGGPEEQAAAQAIHDGAAADDDEPTKGTSAGGMDDDGRFEKPLPSAFTVSREKLYRC